MDFDALTDDQLIELARLLVAEAIRRNHGDAMRIALEREVEAAAQRGRNTARAEEAARVQGQALRAEQQRAAERERTRVRDALRAYRDRIAAAAGREPGAVTLTWQERYGPGYTRGPIAKLNAGGEGLRASWSLVSYDAGTRTLRTSPGLAARAADLEPLMIELCAAVAALGLHGEIVVR